MADVKTCECCRSEFSRASVPTVSNARWAIRRFCSVPCRNAFQRGANAPGWLGDAASTTAGRKRAQALYPETGACEVCGAKSPVDRHHIDGNTHNNERSNIAFLCVKHHIEVEDRYAHLRKTPDAIAERRRAWARERWARRSDEERTRDRARHREYMREYRARLCEEVG